MVFRTGQTYYSWWAYFPVAFLGPTTSAFLNIANWYEQNSLGGTAPTWSLTLAPNHINSGDKMVLLMYRNSPVYDIPHDPNFDSILSTLPIPIGQWVNFEVNYPNRISDGTGQFQVWQDGVLVIDLQNQRGVEGSALVNLWQLQLYGNTFPTPPFLMYTDDIKISASRIADH